jgi:hypothetical protein
MQPNQTTIGKKGKGTNEKNRRILKGNRKPEERVD